MLNIVTNVYIVGLTPDCVLYKQKHLRTRIRRCRFLQRLATATVVVEETVVTTAVVIATAIIVVATATTLRE